MKTVKGLLEHCKKALKNNVQYVYGAKMEVLSLKQIRQLKSMYGSMVWKSDLQKAGHMCCDCSGLISSYTGIVRSSAEYKRTAVECVSIAELKAHWNRYIGWGIWLNGHIGVVSDTEGYYYAMDGSARNMVHNPLSKQPWLYAIKLKDIDYTSEEDVDMKELEKLEERVAALENSGEKVFDSIENVPEWGRPTVEKLVKCGALKGDGDGLDLSYTLLRLLVINDRAGVYDNHS